MAETLLNMKKVAEILGVSRQTIRRHVNLGNLPKPFLVGKQWRWTMKSITDWIEQNSSAREEKETDNEQPEEPEESVTRIDRYPGVDVVKPRRCR